MAQTMVRCSGRTCLVDVESSVFSCSAEPGFWMQWSRWVQLLVGPGSCWKSPRKAFTLTQWPVQLAPAGRVHVSSKAAANGNSVRKLRCPTYVPIRCRCGPFLRLPHSRQPALHMDLHVVVLARYAGRVKVRDRLLIWQPLIAGVLIFGTYVPGFDIYIYIHTHVYMFFMYM